MEALLIGLFLMAAFSPIFTFTNLFQIKEWRLDRLREHLKSEGWLRSVFGLTRPALVGVIGIFGILGIPSPEFWVMQAPIALALLTLAQFLLRRQPIPVWTTKACAIVTLSLLLLLLSVVAFIVSFVQSDQPYSLLLPPFFLVTAVLLSPLSVLSAWILLLPLDALLKRRICARAEHARALFPDLTVIGITGSTGKTTTKALLTHLLQDLCPRATPAHVNSELGVARWLLQILQTADYGLQTMLVVEMGAYREGEIATLCAIIRPTIGILTGISNQHLGLFGSHASIVRSKGELLAALPERGHAFVNGESDDCRTAATRARCRVTFVGAIHPPYAPEAVTETAEGLSFRLGAETFMLPMHGRHNIANVLLAIAAAEHIGIPRERICELLHTFRSPEKTFTVREERGVRILDDTHNLSPASFAAALAWAKVQPQRPRVLLTPGIIELGPTEDAVHREIGEGARGVVDSAVFLSSRRARSFAAGFGSAITMLNRRTPRVSPGTLLLCLGRMPASTIRRLLP